MIRFGIAWLLCLLALPRPLKAIETEILFDGSAVEKWDTARDQARLTREFARNELVADGSPRALRWRFALREAAFNDIFLRQPIARPFTTIRVRVRNPGERFTLAAKVGNAKGAGVDVGPHRSQPRRGLAMGGVPGPAVDAGFLVGSPRIEDGLPFELLHADRV